MSKSTLPNLTVERFETHEVINQPNPLRKFIRRDMGAEPDDPVARAEQALQTLSSEFDGWMQSECDRLTTVHAAFVATSNEANGNELLRVAHDIKGSAATFGYPSAASVAESLCRIIEHAPELAKTPPQLLAHHVKAITAIVREHSRDESAGMSEQLCIKLRGVADEYLMHVNRDRPDHLEAIKSPSIVP